MDVRIEVQVKLAANRVGPGFPNYRELEKALMEAINSGVIWSNSQLELANVPFQFAVVSKEVVGR